jgi:hypothetical protein
LDPLAACLILVTGLAVGWINNLAGAGGALGLVAFDLWAGLDEAQSNAALRPSALAIGASGFVGFLTSGRSVPRAVWGYAGLTIPGAVLGSMLVFELPIWVFRSTLAALLLTILVMQLRSGATLPLAERPLFRTSPWLLVLLFTWLGVHMGFVQVATGLVAIFVLSLVYSRDLVEVNAAKMAIVIVSAIASTLTLGWRGEIAWLPATWLAIGAGAGSFLASRWSIRNGHAAVRAIVIAICAIVLLRTAWNSAFS